MATISYKSLSSLTLVGMITSDGKSRHEIKRHISIGKTPFKRIKNVLASQYSSMQTKYRQLECYVWSMLMYGVETWFISINMQRKLKAAEMWFLRRMLRIFWKDKVCN